MGAGQRSNTLVNPEARKAMDQFKFETANEIGVQIPQSGYMGDLPSRMNGAIGGQMVKKMVQAYQQSIAGIPPTE